MESPIPVEKESDVSDSDEDSGTSESESDEVIRRYSFYRCISLIFKSEGRDM